MTATRAKKNLTLRMSDAHLSTLRIVASEHHVSQTVLVERLIADAGRQLAYTQEFREAVERKVPAQLYPDMGSIAEADVDLPAMDFGGEPEYDTPERDAWLAARREPRAGA